MTFIISHKSGIPIYVQLQDQIKELIRQGVWPGGHRLPSERDLAVQLGISRNTVSATYKQLEADGVICRRQGSGTFVCHDSNSLLAGSGHKERLLKIIDLAISEALQLGFSIEDFTAIIALRVRQRKEMLNRLQVAFVECNREQLSYFTRELELGSGVNIHQLLLQDLLNGTENREKLRQMDMVVTTLYHLDEVKNMLGSNATKVLGIALEPSITSIVRIARVGAESRVPVVCLSKTFGNSVIVALEKANLIFEEMPIITTHDQGQLAQALKEVNTIIASPGRKKDVEQVAPNAEIIEFVFHPDAGSITLLKAALLGIKDSSKAATGV